jgi:hypothetical protein
LSLRGLPAGNQDWLVRKPVELKNLENVLERIRKQVHNAPPSARAALQRAAVGDTVGASLPEPAPSGPCGDPGDYLQLFAPDLKHSLSRRLDEQAFRILCGCVPDIDPRHPTQRRRAYYEPEKLLQGILHAALREAQRQQKPVRVSGSAIEPIYIDPLKRQVWTATPERRLHSASIIPFEAQEMRTETLTPAPEISTERTEPLESFLWKVALWSARGRVPLGTDLDAPVRLSAWPNFTRLWIPPHALRIAALWSRQPHSLLTTARLVAAPQRYVFTFYSAVHALGLAAPLRDAADASPPPEPTRNQGLLKRILSRLISR